MSKEIPLTKEMAEMINIEYSKEATEQEQEGGTWHSVVQSGKALHWDMHAAGEAPEASSISAVDHECIG